jgi:RNA polymerase sigma factor (sigma-70 family)
MNKEEHVCEEKVFDTLYLKHSASIRNYIYYKCGSEAQSYDILQEAYIKLWENCKKVTPDKAKSFLYTVANNLFLNQVAHKKVVLKFAQHKSYEENSSQSPQFLLEEKEFKQKLEVAIANLTDLQREAFLLSRVEGKKYREISEILEVSEKVVSKRIHDALQALRKDIDGI